MGSLSACGSPCQIEGIMVQAYPRRRDGLHDFFLFRLVSFFIFLFSLLVFDQNLVLEFFWTWQHVW